LTSSLVKTGICVILWIMSIRAVIYGRSSPDYPLTAGQQIDRLKAVADEHEWTVIRVFTDRPTSIRKGLDRRPGEAALLDAIRSGEIDRVCISSICRVGRAVPDLVSFLETCRSAGVSLWVDEQRIETAALFDFSRMMALHLRQARRGRILQGLAASRAMSIPCGRPRISRARTEKAERELAAGKGVREAARIAGISAASASRIKAVMKSEVANV
jgi:DNA invertase Pin-like site-specific DNA recombinase